MEAPEGGCQGALKCVDDCELGKLWQSARMPRPWKLLDRVDTEDGPLELRQRDTRDFMISISGRVLMSSIIQRSEKLIAEVGCEHAKKLAAPRVLIGGLGLGCTLRAALDLLPPGAKVTVAELNPVVVAWGQGPLASLTDNALSDRRVEVVVGDVTRVVKDAAKGRRPRFDAIIVDLYLGPSEGRDGDSHPLYGRNILFATQRALTFGGTYTVWGEVLDPSFERRMIATGFQTSVQRSHGGGPRHAVYVGRNPHEKK